MMDTPEHASTSSRRRLLGMLAAGGTTAVAGCTTITGGGDTTSTGGGDSGSSSIVVGSKGYAEQVTLGYVAYELLANTTNATLVDETGFGGNAAISEAYRTGNVHAYYDYMGSLWSSHPPKHDSADFDTPDAQYDALKSEMESEHPIRILDRADWQNTWAVFVAERAVEGTGIQSISDLAAHVNSRNYDIRPAFGDGFRSRSDGLDALLDYYEFDPERVTAWASEREFLETASAQAAGTAVDEGYADLGVGYSTSAWLTDVDNVRVLDDDRNFWPFFHPVGVVHEDVATDAVVAALNTMPDAIPDAETMQALNSRAAASGNQQAAADHLQNNDFI
ncbi:glycine betaine ABC transporter substrate-binding protein [Halobacterium salinarum]|uniref:glycine betaine ABC transporter substrate-binding protein n=1 Tax=Halobacterium salinarum TaxID=2242 RepID=UPI001F1AAF63|nr:glycine betaine ABC transporter substrate-binding protein [Halobacterium salinarum]